MQADSPPADQQSPNERQVLQALARAETHTLTALDLELICAGLPGIDVDDWRLNTGGTLMSHGEHAQLRDWMKRAKPEPACCIAG